MVVVWQVGQSPGVHSRHAECAHARALTIATAWSACAYSQHSQSLKHAVRHRVLCTSITQFLASTSTEGWQHSSLTPISTDFAWTELRTSK